MDSVIRKNVSRYEKQGSPNIFHGIFSLQKYTELLLIVITDDIFCSKMLQNLVDFKN